MAKRIDSKLEDKIVSLYTLGMKAKAILAKITEDGVADGSNITVSNGTIYRVLQENELIDPPKRRAKSNEEPEPEPEDGEHPSIVDATPDKSASLTTTTTTFTNMYQELADQRRVALDERKKAVEVFPLSRIMDVNEFIAEANSLLAPLEEEQRANGELLDGLRAHLDGLALLAHALSVKDSELTKLQKSQAESKSAIAGLNQQVATWQRHAFQRAQGKPSDESLVDRG
tara:strand:+ start:498 stop:1184 length:687 start_codon:yes stop_codon:yes gene_type:complete